MGVGAGWYYDSIDDDVVHQNLAESLANAIFSYYHGPYKTAALAEAHKGVKGPPGKKNEGLGTQVTSAAKATGVSQFLGDLTSRNTLMRIGEGALGVALIIVGVAKLADGTPLGSALKKVPFV